MSIFNDEVRDYYYSLDNPCFSCIKFISEKIASIDFIIATYKNKLRANLYENKSFEEISISISLDNLDIDDIKTLDEYLDIDACTTAIFNSYMVYHFDMGNVLVNRIYKSFDKIFITFSYCSTVNFSSKFGVGASLESMVSILNGYKKE